MTAGVHDPNKALRLIIAAHRAGGRRLTDSEALEFIARPVYLGPPTQSPPRPAGRGRPPKLREPEPYQSAHKRRRLVLGLIHRNAGHVRFRQRRQALQEIIVFAARELQRARRTSPRNLVRMTIQVLELAGIEVSRSTVRRALLSILHTPA